MEFIVGTKMRSKLYLAVVAAVTLTASPAFAGPYTATATAKGTILQSLELVRQSDLDFGTVAPDFTKADTVSIDPDNGNRAALNNFAVLLPGAFGRASFDGFGTAGNTVQLTLGQPSGGIITNGSKTIAARLKMDSTSNSGTLTIPAGGKFTVYVGGDFDIGPNQQSGVYSAQFALTAVYQ